MRRVSYDNSAMRDLGILFMHLVVTVARLFGPGGARSIVAESLLVKHPLLILNRPRVRAPVLRPSDRAICWAVCSLGAPCPFVTLSHRTEVKTVPYVPLSHPFVESISIELLTGVLVICSENWRCLRNITTASVFTADWTALLLTKNPQIRTVRSLAWTHIGGKSAAVVCISSWQQLAY